MLYVRLQSKILIGGAIIEGIVLFGRHNWKERREECQTEKNEKRRNDGWIVHGPFCPCDDSIVGFFGFSISEGE